MTASAFSSVPTLSLAQEKEDPERFATALGRSFERFGFTVIIDHGIDRGLIDRASRLTKLFFDESSEYKNRFIQPGGGGARGYTPFGIEIAKDAEKHDLKEFWHIGRSLAEGHPHRAEMPDNLWPARPEGFQDCFTALFDAFDRAGVRLLSAIARHLDLTPDWFAEPVRDGNSILRLLHYPPVSAEAPGVRAAAHEDINLITLLLGAEEAGLELLDRDGRWLPVTPPENAMVVNVGDMLQRLTNHRLPSTTHRVVNPPPERRGYSRYSMPFFLHFKPDFEIRTLSGCIDARHPDRYPTRITANAFLQERLRAIGLLK